MLKLTPTVPQTGLPAATRGSGSFVYDENGREYLDFTSGIAVTNTGHNHPRVVEAVQRQASQLIHQHYTVMRNPVMETLIQRLDGVLPDHLDSICFSTTGSEAVESALRLARHATGRPNVVVFHGSFHGRSLGAASLTTSGTKVRAGAGPYMSGVAVAPFPQAFRLEMSPQEATRFALRELDYLLSTVSDPRDLAAFIVEPILGEGGYVPGTAEFFAGLRERADAYGALLVLDEIQSGVGRTGTFWAHEQFGVSPDIMTMAKGLASGMPLSAMVARHDLMGHAWPGSQGGTFSGNPLSCASAVATLEVIAEEGLVARAAELGKRLEVRLNEIAAGCAHVADVRGMGLMMGIEIGSVDGSDAAVTTQAIRERARTEGLLLLGAGPAKNIIRLIPPLTISEDDLDRGLDILQSSVLS